MLSEDEFFKNLAKEAIDKYPVISGKCSECPINWIKTNMLRLDLFNDKSYLSFLSYLKEGIEHNNGSVCFITAQKMQLLKIAKVKGIAFDATNYGYIKCDNLFLKKKKIEIIKMFNNFNKI